MVIMSLAATYLLCIGLAALVTAVVLRDRGSRRFWLAGVALTVAGCALTAVVDFGEHRPVHGGIVTGMAVLCVVLIATARRRHA